MVSVYGPKHKFHGVGFVFINVSISFLTSNTNELYVKKQDIRFHGMSFSFEEVKKNLALYILSINLYLFHRAIKKRKRLQEILSFYHSRLCAFAACIFAKIL